MKFLVMIVVRVPPTSTRVSFAPSFASLPVPGRGCEQMTDLLLLPPQVTGALGVAAMGLEFYRRYKPRQLQ